MRRVTRRREGFALALALVAIAVIGMLITGVFFGSTQEFRIGRNTLLQTRALTAAEYGQNAVISPTRWNSAWNTSLARGAVAVQAFRPGDGSTDTVRITRLSDRSFLVVSEGRVGRGLDAGATRRVATLLQLNIPQMNIPSALTARSGTNISGSSQISGRDSTLAGWGCEPAGPTKPGVVTVDASEVTASGTCKDFACITGSPPVKEDPMAADTNTYFTYGDVNWNDLKATAKRLASTNLQGVGPSYLADGSCDKTALTNWGDPGRNSSSPSACESYFPVIYAPGDLTLNSGMAQGILLVEGNLSVQGGFQFNGPVIVRGQLKTTGTGGHFNGGVMAADVELGENKVSGNAVITYSSCAIAKALAGSAIPRVATGRAWVELFR